MIDINVSLFIQIANFLLLLLLLNIVLYRPLRGMIRQRRERMDSLTAETDQNKQKNDEVVAKISEGLRQARAEAAERRAVLKNEGLELEKSLLDRIHQEMEAETADMSARIQEQRRQARDSLLGQVDVFSLAAAEKILGRSV